MILKFLKTKAVDMALSEEADELEARLGPVGAIRHVREQIAVADRSARQHLYRLHDEIVRRRPGVSAA